MFDLVSLSMRLMVFIFFAISSDNAIANVEIGAKFYDYNPDIVNFWNQGVTNKFTGSAGKQISYRTFVSSEERGALILLNGASFSYEHFDETAFDLNDQGLTLFLMDHRGQGHSERLVEDPEKTHIDKFEYFVSDLEIFIKKIVKVQINDKPIYVICVSQSCAFLTYILANNPYLISKAVFVAPMTGIKRGFIPLRVANFVSNTLIRFNQSDEYLPIFENGGWKVISKNNSRPFSSRFTHDFIRYWKEVYQQFKIPSIRMGGVTTGWFHRMNKGISQAFPILHQIRTEIVMFQAGDDFWVTSESQDQFCNGISTCRKILLASSKHEIFREIDVIRNEVLSTIKIFLSE